jgi:Cu/Ag efflux protein CusF
MGARARAFRRTTPILVLLVILGLTACRSKSPDSGRIYTVRAQVVRLPDPANPGTGLTLNHEAVDDFVDRSGEVVGMDPMSMPFPVAEGVSLDGIQVGDVVEVELRVDWGGDPEVAITGVRELPAGTKLVFRAARPPKKSST